MRSYENFLRDIEIIQWKLLAEKLEEQTRENLKKGMEKLEDNK